MNSATSTTSLDARVARDQLNAEVAASAAEYELSRLRPPPGPVDTRHGLTDHDRSRINHAVQRRAALEAIADKGYDTDAIRAALLADRIRPVIPPRLHRTTPIRWNRRLYRERTCIERMIGHLKVDRAVATRYDKLANSFLDVLHVATIRKCLRVACL